MDSTNFKPIVETVEIHDGLGVFEIRGSLDKWGNPFESCLYFEGRLIALNWPDCSGSVAEYLVRSNDGEYQKAAQQLISLQDFNIKDGLLLSNQLHSVIQLFSNGLYELSCTSPDHRDVMIFDLPQAGQLTANHYYQPDNFIFARTIPNHHMNQSRVVWWREKILKGERPPVIVVNQKDAWSSFIIDGHHRLDAYRALNINPVIITIASQNFTKVTDDKTTQILEGFPELLENFRRNTLR
jgi:hypothetical protein